VCASDVSASGLQPRLTKVKGLRSGGRRRRVRTREPRRALSATLVVGVVVLAVVAIVLHSRHSGTGDRTLGSVPTSTAAEPAVDIGSLRSQYLDAISSFNAALGPLGLVVDSMQDQPNVGTLRSAAQTYLPGLRSGTARIAAIGWPQSIRFDANTFAANEATLESVLAALPNDTSGLRTWVQQWGLARSELDAADRVIRHDLGMSTGLNS